MKAALTQSKNQRTKQNTVLAPVIDLKQGGSSDDWQIVATQVHEEAGLKDPVPSEFSAGEVLIPLADQYDPMFPNDYEKVVKHQREERQRQWKLERQKEVKGKKGVKTDMKLMGFQGDQIQILKKMKLMSEKGGKEVWEFLSFPTTFSCREKQVVMPKIFHMKKTQDLDLESTTAIPPPVYRNKTDQKSSTGPATPSLLT
jgi:splicing factor 45